MHYMKERIEDGGEHMKREGHDHRDSLAATVLAIAHDAYDTITLFRGRGLVATTMLIWLPAHGAGIATCFKKYGQISPNMDFLREGKSTDSSSLTKNRYTRQSEGSIRRRLTHEATPAPSQRTLRPAADHQSRDPHPAGSRQRGQAGCPRRACPGVSLALPAVRHPLLYPGASQQAACPAVCHPPLRTLAPGGYPAGGGHCPVVAYQPRPGLPGLRG